MRPPKGPAFARSGSTWIHCWSPVASANPCTRSWVISSQSLSPTWRPTSASNPSTPCTTTGSATAGDPTDPIPGGRFWTPDDGRDA